MEFMGKKLEDIIVNLPLADGSTLTCGVCASFDVMGKHYFALLPFKEDQTPDFSQSYMLYRVEEDEEHNPIILYIENDYEYAVAANYFQKNYLDKPTH